MPDQLSPEEAAAFVALTNAQAGAHDTILERLRQAVRAILAGLAGRWYDRDAVIEAGRELAELVRSAQVVAGDVTGIYLDHVFDLTGITPPAEPITLPTRLRNVDSEVQWGRPASEFRRMRARGLDEFEASERARQRAETMAEMDVNLAMREAARQRIVAVDAVVGYRRIIHPERSRTGTCGLCLVASDRLYHKRELLPLHDGCRCEVLPVVKGKPDPGVTLNGADLKDIYAKAGGTGRAALKKIRVRTVHHGELGPILVDAGHRFRTAQQAHDDLRATA